MAAESIRQFGKGQHYNRNIILQYKVRDFLLLHILKRSTYYCFRLREWHKPLV